MKELSIIVAIDDNYGISKNNRIPWYNSKDLQYFKKVTTEKILIMGNKTWNSIPNKNKFQQNRICFVLSTKHPYVIIDWNEIKLNETYFVNSYENTIHNLLNCSIPYDIFIIGGKMLYKKAFETEYLNYVYLTRIQGDYQCDNNIKFLHQELDYRCELTTSETLSDFTVIQKYKVFSEEQMYLKLLKNVYRCGVEKNDRTGVGTFSLFGAKLSFSLKNNKMPLLTTKKTYWKGIVHELLWFLNGNTNSKKLEENNVNIWKQNSSREFLDDLGFNHREVGDLGPVYGFQWRHWGAKYETMYTDYTKKGIDQLKQLIETIKTEPSSRRLILSAWNVSDLKEMALPPCHMMCQFYVNGDELSCQLYQRSADLFLGVPFNIASYALLTHIIAKLVGLKASVLNIVFGDVHIYKTHLDAVKEQLTRLPFQFPTICIQKDIKDVSELFFDDIVLQDYNCHNSIKAPMAV
jgi:dihydrofolate reductase/thymidylate synthase